ncbi:PLU-1-like protein-domain-containing protein [Kalaharituber pfeilii]|nr:PLU-1-like protein-domain-containing protein [Kalaharituber pfeilii]
MPGTAAVSSSSSAAGSHSNRPSPRVSNGPSTRMKAGGSGNGGGSTPGATTGNTNGINLQGSYQTAPLSSRRAHPLDLNTVERRGTPTAVKEVTKLIRPHNLHEAPTYRPTMEEWKEPFEYIKKISPEGSKYGIVKIIPPDGWNPDFAVDTERFHFRTRRQELNSVEGGNRANLNYLDQLAKFHSQSGSSLSRFPCVDKRPLDLYRLKKAVEIRGGFQKVCKLKKWAEIGRDLGYSGKIMSSLSTSLKNSYQRYLHPYEEWVKQAKPGLQAHDSEHGNSTAGGSPMKGLPKDRSSLRPESPASKGLLSSNNALSTDTDDTDKDTVMGDDTLKGTPAPSASGFAAVKSSSFTPVNSSPSGFTSVNSTPNGIKREMENGLTLSRRSESSLSTKNTPELKGTPLKRSHNVESNESTPAKNAEESETGERRSKRLKKDSAPTVAGSHMTLHRPQPTPRSGAQYTKAKPGEKCETCGRGTDNVNMLICDGCDHGYHTYCLDPVVKNIPERDWYCNRCLVGTGEFGFADGGVYSLRQFQEKANNFKENYFQPKMPFDPVHNTKRQATEDDVEREFWRLVESLTETVEVEYGADIHSTTHGSGFPTIEKDPLNPYSTDPWNLNILPLNQDSLFRHIKSDVSGMTVPWLYVGMCFSTFCWHNEDHYTYSANYQHFGATKTWYGIPGADAEKFENAMREAVPELFEQQPDLLFQLVTLLTPQQLQKAGVSVYALDQRAGQFVITFPQAYHAGFNHGFNFNEAVNFAPADWEPFGQAGVERYQQFRKAPVFSHDELLLTCAARDTSIKTATWLAPALARIRDRELAERNAIRQKIEDLHEQVLEEDLSEDQYQCGVCKVYCYLSQVTCQCTSNVTCPTHYKDICDCGPSNLTLRLRYCDDSLIDIVAKVADKANLPKAWIAKLEKSVADTSRPQLKLLRSLLAEGERIPYPISELGPLKEFVERCNEWVDEATNYITRKQQNRRKNEKAWRKGTAKAAELEERDKEHRKLENIMKLLEEADVLEFDCPEIDQLRERANSIQGFRQQANAALNNPTIYTTQAFEELIEHGKSFNVDLVEVDQLEKVLRQLKWIDHARDCRGRYLCLQDVAELINQGVELEIPDTNEQMAHYKSQKVAGDMWESKAKELMSVEIVHFQQLEALSGQASTLPVSRETLAQVDQILNKQREAHKQIISLYQRSQLPDSEQRPKYKDVREVMDSLAELHSKPTGTIDLEKEQKRHEDWMRRGKKLFGKANAPLHILQMHMNYVETRNQACFNLEDRPRTPVEPSSREPSPIGGSGDSSRGRPREVFCICRAPEAGMMIECEVCHEWYHGKCLKIARGKVKEDDKYTCPICDYRVKIPRDAARPKLEELIEWRNEIPKLPFIPDEKDCLDRIIETAQNFRDNIQPFTNSLGLSQAEVPMMRFYLRKIEGAEILLAHETNFFRTELHRWMPIAPDPPPIIDCSNSTRKPRPTKQQKLMAQYGVNTPEELPMTLRTKAHTFKKKTNEPNKPAPIKPAPHKGSSHPPSSSSMSPVQMHTPSHGIQQHPQFDYGGSRFSMPGSTQVSPHQYSQTNHSMSTSPIPMGALRNGDSPLLNSYQSGMGGSSRDRERDQYSAREVNHMFETLTNQDADNLYTREPATSSAASTSSNSSSTPNAGDSLSSSSAPSSMAAVSLRQLTSDVIDPFLNDTAMRD